MKYFVFSDCDKHFLYIASFDFILNYSWAITKQVRCGHEKTHGICLVWWFTEKQWITISVSKINFMSQYRQYQSNVCLTVKQLLLCIYRIHWTKTIFWDDAANKWSSLVEKKWGLPWPLIQGQIIISNSSSPDSSVLSSRHLINLWMPILSQWLQLHFVL